MKITAVLCAVLFVSACHHGAAASHPLPASAAFTRAQLALCAKVDTAATGVVSCALKDQRALLKVF